MPPRGAVVVGASKMPSTPHSEQISYRFSDGAHQPAAAVSALGASPAAWTDDCHAESSDPPSRRDWSRAWRRTWASASPLRRPSKVSSAPRSRRNWPRPREVRWPVPEPPWEKSRTAAVVTSAVVASAVALRPRTAAASEDSSMRRRSRWVRGGMGATPSVVRVATDGTATGAGAAGSGTAAAWTASGAAAGASGAGTGSGAAGAGKGSSALNASRCAASSVARCSRAVRSVCTAVSPAASSPSSVVCSADISAAGTAASSWPRVRIRSYSAERAASSAAAASNGVGLSGMAVASRGVGRGRERHFTGTGPQPGISSRAHDRPFRT